MNYTKLEFRGDGLTFFLYLLGSYIFTIITLYIGIPWVYCWRVKWYQSNLYLDNRRLHFRGTGAQVFGLFIVILLASIFTLGLYIPFGMVRLEKWKWENTFFEDEILQKKNIPVKSEVKKINVSSKNNTSSELLKSEKSNLLLPAENSEKEKSKITITEEKDFTCLNCGSLITLEGDELKQSTYTCPVCQNVNRIQS